nr:hypothetical protein BaRGS_016832 [Batillaria attramentaria]
MEVIHELPRNPRFSSFMSPEAQYAMMKGYEDKLYEDLAGSFPESALSLKRNRTPHQKISIRGKSASRPGGGRSETIGEGSESGTEDDSKSGSDVSSSRTSPSHLSVAPAATRASTFITSSSSPSSNGKSPDRLSPMSTSSSSSPVPTPSPFLRPIGRRQSVHVHTDVNGNAVTSSTSPPPAQTTQLHRSHSLPVLAGAGVPHDRRLVLSYRLESAMDILDTIRRRKGEYSLSPRVYSKPRPIVPV